MFRIDFPTILDANKWMIIYGCEYVGRSADANEMEGWKMQCSVIHCAHEIRNDSVVGGSLPIRYVYHFADQILYI